MRAVVDHLPTNCYIRLLNSLSDSLSQALSVAAIRLTRGFIKPSLVQVTIIIQVSLPYRSLLVMEGFLSRGGVSHLLGNDGSPTIDRYGSARNVPERLGPCQGEYW